MSYLLGLCFHCPTAHVGYLALNGKGLHQCYMPYNVNPFSIYPVPDLCALMIGSAVQLSCKSHGRLNINQTPRGFNCGRITRAARFNHPAVIRADRNGVQSGVVYGKRVRTENAGRLSGTVLFWRFRDALQNPN